MSPSPRRATATFVLAAARLRHHRVPLVSELAQRASPLLRQDADVGFPVTAATHGHVAHPARDDAVRRRVHGDTEGSVRESAQGRKKKHVNFTLF